MASTFFCASPRWPPSSGAATCSRRKSRSLERAQAVLGLAAEVGVALRPSRPARRPPAARRARRGRARGRQQPPPSPRRRSARGAAAACAASPAPRARSRSARRSPRARRASDTGCCRTISAPWSIRLRSSDRPPDRRAAPRRSACSAISVRAASCACPARPRARQQVPVPDAGVKLDAVPGERAREIGDQGARLLRGETAAREVHHQRRPAIAAIDRDQVEAERDVAGRERDAATPTASSAAQPPRIARRVVAEHRERSPTSLAGAQARPACVRVRPRMPRPAM